MEQTIDVLNKVNAIYSVFIQAFGTLGNILCCIICLRPNLRKTPTLIFYALLLLSDAFSLHVWNFDHYLVEYHGVFVENLGLYVCKFATLLQCFSLQFSAWLLVAMTFERYLSIRFLNWRLYNKPKTAIIISSVIGAVLFIINVSFMINLKFTNDNSTVGCFGEDTYLIWMQVILN